jgi:pimeloyl-ACP methyl ester carboxylesterase
VKGGNVQRERFGIVFVHGLFSSERTWERFERLVKSDAELTQFVPLADFTYWSPRIRINRLRRIPDLDTVADHLRTYLDNDVRDFRTIVLVAHSMGGLVVQRYLSRMIIAGRGAELARIRSIVMFACPNDGTVMAEAFARYVRGWKHPQIEELRVLNKQVFEARQLVVERVVFADRIASDRCPIEITACVGEIDNIVRAETGKGVFRKTAIVPGDHFSLIQPDSHRHRSYLVLKNQLSAVSRSANEALDASTGVAPWTKRAIVDQHRLFGIDGAVARIGSWLENPDGDWLISIFGAGGAGKTTLAYEAVKRHAHAAGFANVAWVSARSSYLAADGQVERDERVQYYWRELLLDIASQLPLTDKVVAALAERQFAHQMRTLAAREKCLIVIDNMESVVDSRYAIRYLHDERIIRPHKVVITTRDSAASQFVSVRQLRWDRLQNEAAHEFAKYLASDDPAFQLDSNDLDRITDYSGGLPLVIKIMIRLCLDRGQSVAEVIDRLRKRSQGSSGLGAFLYDEGLAALQQRVGEKTASDLMNVFCSRSVGQAVELEEFYLGSGIASRDEFDEAKAAAARLALITPSRGNTLFSVHSLLREFMCNDGTNDLV